MRFLIFYTVILSCAFSNNLYGQCNINIQTSDSILCFGEQTTLNASGASVYQWSPSKGLNTNRTNSVIAKPDTTTTYIVKGLCGQWKQISTGVWHTLAIRTDGTLWAWGNNGHGQLGDGTHISKHYPVQIGNDTWKEVAAGGYHSIGIKSDGSVWAWGANSKGQLGCYNYNNSNRPVKCNFNGDTNVFNGFAVSAGNEHSAVILSYQQLPNNSNYSLWTCGDNSVGQLGYPAPLGGNKWYQFLQPSNQPFGYQKISCGAYHTIGIKILQDPFNANNYDSTLWAWGNNSEGQLGDGTTTNKFLPIQIGSFTDWKSVKANVFHSVGLRLNNQIYGWGNNLNGELGDGTFVSRLAPIRIGTSDDWREISAGLYHTLAIKLDGSLWSWGNNFWGQLGLGDYTSYNLPTKVGNDNNWEGIVAYDRSSLAIKIDSSIYGWGDNRFFQLGLGDTTRRNIPFSISADYDTIIVKINPLPNNTITISGPSEFCQGNNTKISCIDSVNNTFIWKKDGTVIQNENKANITVNSTGQYKVKITNTVGCIDSSTNLNIIVNPLPIVNIINPQVNSICSGDSLLLTISNNSYNYNWKMNGLSLDVNNAILTVRDSGFYKAIATTTKGCVDSTQNVEVLINPLPNRNIVADGSTSLCTKSSVLLRVTNEEDQDQFQWYRNNNRLINYTQNNNFATDSGSYWVEVIDKNQCKNNSNVITVSLAPMPSIDSISGEFSNIKADSSYIYKVYAQNKDQRYNWSVKGGSIIGGSDMDSVIIKWDNYTNAAKIQLRTALNDCFITDSIQFQINTGFHDLNKIVYSRIYPNPNNGKFTIKVRTDLTGNGELKIYSSLGQLILVQEIKLYAGENDFNINTSIKKGGYYIILSTVNGQLIQRFSVY